MIPRFVAAALASEPPGITGDGEQTRDFTHVTDVVETTLLVCETPGIAASVFNVGGGRRISVNDLWSEIRRQIGSTAEPRYVTARAGDVRDSLACLERSRQAFSYEPRITLERGLEDTVRSFRLQQPISRTSR